MDTKFEDGAYIALSGASGVWDQDFHFIKSLKTMNPNKIDKSHHAEEAKMRKGQKYIEDLESADLMHQNRLQYKDTEDLIKKINSEISKFKFHSSMVDNLIRRNKDNLPEDQNHLINMDRIHSDLDTIMRDFATIERMLNNTNYLIGEVEKRPPIKPKRNQDIGQVDAKIAQLENVIRDVNSRTANLENKLKESHDKSKETAVQSERTRRQQLSEAKVTDGVPQSIISPELHSQIESSKEEIRSKTGSGGSWLKTIVTWGVMIGIAYLMYSVYTGLKQEKLKL